MRTCTIFLITLLLTVSLADVDDNTTSSSAYPPHQETVSVPIYNPSDHTRKHFYDRLMIVYDPITNAYGKYRYSCSDKFDKFREELYSEFSKSIDKVQLESRDFIAPVKAAWYAERLIRGDCPKELESLKSQSDEIIYMMIDNFLAYIYESSDSPSQSKDPFILIFKEKIRESLALNYFYGISVLEFLVKLFEYLNFLIYSNAIDFDLELSNKGFVTNEMVDLFKSIYIYAQLEFIAGEIVDAEFLEKLTRNIVILFNMYDKDSRINGKPLRFISSHGISNFVTRALRMLPVVQSTQDFGNYDTLISMDVETFIIKTINKFESENGLTLATQVEQRDLVEAIRSLLSDYAEDKTPVESNDDSGLYGFIKAAFEYYENPQNIDSSYTKILNAYITQKHRVKSEL